MSSLEYKNMDQPDLHPKKLKVVRVVTASYVVPWHLGNTLDRMHTDFEVCVVGQGVSSCAKSYTGVNWVDVDLDRKVSLVSDAIALFTLCRFFISYKPDIVHSIMPKAGLLTAIAGFICRVPVRIHTFTGQVWATRTGIPRAVYYWLDRLINALNTVCLTDSPSQSTFLYKNKISRAGKRLPVLSKGSLSGVDISRFDTAALSLKADILRNRLGLDRSNFVFTFLARKTRDKGAIDVLEAFSTVSKQISRARLLFVGPDESGGALKELIGADPGLFNHVIDIGQVDDHELYLAISDVLCLPSYREGFGSIVIDAAALGVPTIGSNIPGLVDSIEDGKTGVLFPVGDVSALAEVMMDCFENPGKYEKMRIDAKLRVINFFTADLLYDALKTLYLKFADN